MTEVMAAGGWKSNAEMIADVAMLGWLDGSVMDLTYGLGKFWERYRPPVLWTNDLHTEADYDHNVLDLPDDWEHRFGAVVFDPPYKLNGTPSQEDVRYGVHHTGNFNSRMNLITDGSLCAARCVAPGGYLHIKCQNQINGSRFINQVRMVTSAVLEDPGMAEAGQWIFTARPRPQPSGRMQRTPRNNVSYLLSFRRKLKLQSDS